MLSAFPDRQIEVVVKSITPVTQAAEGRNYYNVEASLSDDKGILRPGMEGVAKINISEERLVWIWSREMINWLRLWAWRWVE